MELEQRINDVTNKEAIRQFGIPKILKTLVWTSDQFDAIFYVLNDRANHIFGSKILCCMHGIKINLPDTRDFSSQVIVLLDIKQNNVDYNVAREFLIDNDRLQVLLRDVAKAFVSLISKEFSTKLKGKAQFDRLIPLYYQFRMHIGHCELFRYLTDEDRANSVLSGVNPIITKKAILYKKLSTLLDTAPETVIIFDCTDSLIKRRHNQKTSQMVSLIQESLKENDSVLLYFGPYFYQWEDVISSVMNDSGIYFEWGDLEEYAAKSCQVVTSKIDCLLPTGCHLATIPIHYGKEVVRNKAFISKNRRYNIKDSMFNWTTTSRYGPILFFDDFPEIYEMLLKQGVDEDELHTEVPVSFFKNLKRSTHPGEYLLRVENEWVNFILSNYEKIEKDSTLIELSKIIIRSLLIIHTEESLYLDIFSKGLLTEASFLLKSKLKTNIF